MKQVLSVFAILILALPVAAGPPETCRVTRGNLQATVTLNGVFRARPAAEVRLPHREYGGPFLVAECVAPGAHVASGETVLRLDTDRISEAIEDARFDLAMTRRNQAEAEQRAGLADRAAAEDLDNRGVAVENAQHALTAFVDFEKPRAEEQDALADKADEQGVKNAQDELDQLVKMYEEDELVDETEKIVMARARFSLEQRRARAELAHRQRVWRAEHDRVEQEKALRRNLATAQAVLERAREGADIDRDARKVDHERLLRKVADKQQRIDRLVSERDAMTVRAPAEGIVQFGGPDGDPGRLLRPGDSVDPSAPVVTILDPEAMRLAAQAPAREVLRILAGRPVHVVPAAVGAAAIDGTIESVAPPTGDSLRVFVRLADTPLAALLGTPAAAKVVVADEKDVLLLPLAAVDRKGDHGVCEVPGKTGPVARMIHLGPDDGTNVVVLDGLAEGDEVILPGTGK